MMAYDVFEEAEIEECRVGARVSTSGPPVLDDELAKIVMRVVEGQITSFLNDHPEIAGARIGKLKPGRTKAEALRDSIAKRINRDLLSPQTRARIAQALGAATPEA